VNEASSPTSSPTDSAAVRLPDGRLIEFRRVTPDDRPLIVEGLQRLSATSSWRRFHMVRRRLSERELFDLTNLDDPSRFALGASARFPDGRVEGVGIARYVRLDGAPATAEIAVAVLDDYQGLGIGALLLRRLAREARRRGVRRLSGSVMHENVPMLRLLERHARGIVRRVIAEHVAFEYPLLPA
jgi:GNAT superfamily N-acetyltransferase